MSNPSRIPSDCYGWRSVRDAPRNEKIVLGFYCCDDKPDCIIMQTLIINGVFEDAMCDPDFRMTHWMPLFPAPEDWEDRWCHDE